MADSLRLMMVSEDLALPTDEGLKKFVYSVAHSLSELVELMVVSTGPSNSVGEGVTIARANLMMSGRDLRKRIQQFHPTHVLYVPRSGGTRNAFIRSWQLGRYHPTAQRAMVILQSRHNGPVARVIVRRLRPARLFTQGPSIARSVERLGLETYELPSGVDPRQFSPVDDRTRIKLREKFALPSSADVVLHVGHLIRTRNVLLMARIRRELDCEAVVVASTSTPHDADVKAQLTTAGVRVIDTYVDNIAEMYQVADCYVFPVRHAGGAIQMPLSVLESLASGTAVVCTRFGSLGDWLSESNCVRFAESDDELVTAVRATLASERPSPAAVREVALDFSWDAVARRLLTVLAGSNSWSHREPSAEGATLTLPAGSSSRPVGSSTQSY